MYGPHGVEDRIRRETGYRSLRVRFDPALERWVVYDVSRRLGGRRTVPFSISDEGELVPGSATIRTVEDDLSPIVTLQTREGGYQPLDPNLILEELAARDRLLHPRIVEAMFAHLAEAKARRFKRAGEDFVDDLMEHRREFARAADEAGL